MNTALWMLYLADVAVSATVVLCLVAVALGLGFTIWRVAAFVENDSYREVKIQLPPKWMLHAALGCLVVSALIPSKQTLYAMAAANLGEKALQTQTGDKAVRALNAWLDRQITPEPTKD